MKTTYEKGYRIDLEGNGWTLYSITNHKDSLIVHALESIVYMCKEDSFEQVYEKLEERYKNRTEKSRCYLYKDEDQIYVTTKGIFPRFYVLRKP